MPFHPPIDSYFSKVFAPAIEDAGLIASRGDSLFRAGDIVRQVVGLIRDADLVLAEISQLNANVYYEVGIAHALGKPTVLVSQNAATVPFDLRGGRVLVYSTENPFWGDLLRADVTRSIIETAQDPASALPPGLTLAMGESGGSPVAAGDSDRLKSIEARLSQLQRALGRSTVDNSVSSETLARAEAAKETIFLLLEQSLDKRAIVRELVSSGVSELWAETAVDEELSRRGRK